MTSEIDKLKHFHVENYSGTNFTDDLNDGEEFLYTTIRCKDDKEVTLLCKHAIKELKLSGYGNGEGGPNDWMYQQVIEAVAVFASHGNSGSSALPVEDRIKFILHGESTLLILLIMELEEKVKELIKWYMDTYGVNKDQAVRDIESVMLCINHK